jgi:hypothetical protein
MRESIVLIFKSIVWCLAGVGGLAIFFAVTTPSPVDVATTWGMSHRIPIGNVVCSTTVLEGDVFVCEVVPSTVADTIWVECEIWPRFTNRSKCMTARQALDAKVDKYKDGYQADK